MVIVSDSVIQRMKLMAGHVDRKIYKHVYFCQCRQKTILRVPKRQIFKWQGQGDVF
jgi:hypothetical protein